MNLRFKKRPNYVGLYKPISQNELSDAFIVEILDLVLACSWAYCYFFPASLTNVAQDPHQEKDCRNDVHLYTSASGRKVLVQVPLSDPRIGRLAVRYYAPFFRSHVHKRNITRFHCLMLEKENKLKICRELGQNRTQKDRERYLSPRLVSSDRVNCGSNRQARKVERASRTIRFHIR